MSAAVAWKVNGNLASGAHPGITFPNAHLISPAWAPLAQQPANQASRQRVAKWSAPQAGSPLQELQQAVKDEDWTRDYEEGLTTIGMRADWSASPERCSFLNLMASSIGARRVLEVGSFCGVAALSLAESLPQDAQVRALEIDPFVVKLGERYRNKSAAGHKIVTQVGPAMAALEQMAREARAGKLEPFDLVVIDADKAGMRGYFNLVWQTPGLLSERALVCVDLTAFKGQPPLRYVKYGFPYPWEASSGQEHIDSIRAHVAASPQLRSHEVGSLLVVQSVSVGN